MKKAALIVLGAVAAVLLLATVIGYTLPAKHRAERSVVVAGVQPGQVYELLTDIRRYPAWRSGMDSVVTLPSPGPHARFREFAGGDVILYAIEEAVPNERFVTRIAQPDLPFGGTWTYTVRPVTGGTELRILEDGEVHNPLFRTLSRFVFGHTATIDRYLEDVQRALNAGSQRRL